METTKPSAPLETERMCWDEIRERYSDQYVCMVDVTRHPTTRAITARVVGHGPNRRTAFAPIREVVERYPDYEIMRTSVNVPIDGEIEGEVILVNVGLPVLDDAARAFLNETPRFVIRRR
jgi:hypothetical protein